MQMRSKSGYREDSIMTKWGREKWMNKGREGIDFKV